jgi:site-specific recombinase XerD
LQQERGLEPSTIRRYTLVVRRFLQRTPQGPRARLSALQAQDVCDFIRQYAPRAQSFSMGKDATTALRSFLRFARLHDYIHTDLAAAVPAVPGWSMASIPRAMPLQVVRRVLAHSKRRRTPMGLRDRAILLLLARLGLRAREVVLLKLHDIDWRTSSLRIQGKTRQEHPLPMPAEVGEAIANYLRRGRPKTSRREVFLCSRAPLRGLGGSPTIVRILHRALARAGIHLAHEGTHQFRHALATQMLRKGLSLTEIGQLLRHHSADATRRYAKVDLRALREVALPWPAGVP